MVLSELIDDLVSATRAFAERESIDWVDIHPPLRCLSFGYEDDHLKDERSLVFQERDLRVGIVKASKAIERKAVVISDHGTKSEKRFATVLRCAVCPRLQTVYKSTEWFVEPWRPEKRQLDLPPVESQEFENSFQSSKLDQMGMFCEWQELKLNFFDGVRALLQDLMEIRGVQERLTAARLSLYEQSRIDSKMPDKRQKSNTIESLSDSFVPYGHRPLYVLSSV